MPVFKLVFLYLGEQRELYIHAENEQKAEDTAILLMLILHPALKLLELVHMGFDFTV